MKIITPGTKPAPVYRTTCPDCSAVIEAEGRELFFSLSVPFDNQGIFGAPRPLPPAAASAKCPECGGQLEFRKDRPAVAAPVEAVKDVPAKAAVDSPATTAKVARAEKAKQAAKK